MHKILFVIIVFSFVNVFSQVKDVTVPKLKDNSVTNDLSVNKLYALKSGNLADNKLEPVKENFPAAQKKKSPGLAFLYSLAIPGMGQVYSDRFDVGKYFMISEASLWLGYAAFTIYGNWLLDDAYNFAATHAGITNDGKERDDKFYIDIGNYENYEAFNNEKLIYGEYESLYLPENGYFFWWDKVENRKKYREDKLAGDRTKNDRLFIVGAILINHIVSAISAIVLTNNYNKEITKGSGGFVLNADVVKLGNRVDGVKLKLTKWF
jgi:hypothetical protein